MATFAFSAGTYMLENPDSDPAKEDMFLGSIRTISAAKHFADLFAFSSSA